MASRADHSVRPSDRLRCDLALWEISPGLLDGVRDRLQGVQRIEGPHLISERGNWHGRSMLISSSRSSESLAMAFEALALTHHPQHFFVVGEGACEPEALLELPLIWASELIDGEANQLPYEVESHQQTIIKELPFASVAEGSIRINEVDSDRMIVTTNWSLKVYDALQQSGLRATLFVAQNSQPLSEGMLRPLLIDSNPKISRQLGRIWGQLWSQPKQITKSLKQPTDRWRRQRQIANQIEAIVERID